MVFRHVLIFILTFNYLAALDAFQCGKGERVIDRGHGRRSCAPCPSDTFQDTNNYSQMCKACTNCIRGSFIKQNCTKETDTKCQCSEGFVPSNIGSAICKRPDPVQVKDECGEGHFSLGNGQPCQKWTDCKATGVKVRGTSTSDAICNDVLENGLITVASTSKQSVSPIHSTTYRPHEGAPMPMTHSTTSATTQAGVRPPTHVNTGNHFGQALLIFGIAMLLVLTVVTCKLSVYPHMQKGPTLHMNDSWYRQPVEESGDSSEASAKLNLEP